MRRSTPFKVSRAERRPGRHVLGDDGSQVGEALDELAELKERCFGTLARRKVIVPRVADGAEENRRRARAGGPGLLGKTRARRHRAPTSRTEIPLFRCWCENLAATASRAFSASATDLWADAVTGKEDDRKLHGREMVSRTKKRGGRFRAPRCSDEEFCQRLFLVELFRTRFM